jgi:hypothetical protein
MPCFPGTSFPLSAGGPDAFPSGVMLFPAPRLMFSGSDGFAFPMRSLPFPLGCLFVRRHPGGPAYPTYIRAAARYALGLASGFAPLTPARPAKGSGLAKAKDSRAMRTTAARASGVFIRLHSEEKELLRLNADIRCLSVSDYIWQNCLSFHLRKSPMEKERLRQLARIGANINQLAKWTNTYKHALEAVEILTALAGIERNIIEFMTQGMSEKETEDGPCS